MEACGMGGVVACAEKQRIRAKKNSSFMLFSCEDSLHGTKTFPTNFYRSSSFSAQKPCHEIGMMFRGLLHQCGPSVCLVQFSASTVIPLTRMEGPWLSQK